jgi:hypothetical protein
MTADADHEPDALDFALATAVRIALGHDDPEAFLDWLRKYGLKLFIEAGVIPDIPPADWPAVGTVLGRAILNHLPDPRNDFRPRKLPEPGRNDPCPCASGRKYKQCCGGVGSEYEAWLYRRDHHAAWQAAGALDWARSCRPVLRRRR